MKKVWFFDYCELKGLIINCEVQIKIANKFINIDKLYNLILKLTMFSGLTEAPQVNTGKKIYGLPCFHDYIQQGGINNSLLVGATTII